MGSAAALHLARQGQRTLVLERFGVAHDRGSSHGLTRIIRLAYFEHPSYVPLLRRAFELWRDLERQAGEPILHVTGSLDAGPVDSRTVSGSIRSCREHDLPYDVLTPGDLAARFPAYRLPAGHVGVFQPDGGFLVPERCIAASLELARVAGADVRPAEGVVRWEAKRGAVTVDTARGTYEAGQLVVAAGAWAPALVPSLGPLLTPERQVVAWFDVADRDAFAPERFPVFNLEWEGEHWYGFPEFSAPGFKVGCYHHRREAVDPERLDRAHVDDDDLALLRPLVRACFAGAQDEVLQAKVCIFTNTPDEDFIIDRLPGSPEVLIASACSGHGFKFAAVVGEIVADLIARGSTTHDIARHALARFPQLSA
ncbi:MAG: N-methyl-L-tryptophan oxidase [Gemmatimonadaceae bacterium]|nr:N-methyl-L-tryptophan oxidase [Gemmatimonadaceae bacterium]